MTWLKKKVVQCAEFILSIFSFFFKILLATNPCSARVNSKRGYASKRIAILCELRK